MRVVQNIQMQIGEVDVSKVKFDLKSRDDIPKILRGLQHLYVIPTIRTKLFALLEENIAPLVDKHNGRPGMTLWRIFVCGTVRLDLNIDYDRLHELVNQHNTLREMLGHAQYDEHRYHFQTLKDNVSLFTPELLDKVNQLVVESGHILLKKRRRSAAWAVRFLCSRCVTNASESLRCCTEDGSRPPEIGLQELISNRQVLLRPKGVVVSDCGKGAVKGVR